MRDTSESTLSEAKNRIQSIAHLLALGVSRMHKAKRKSQFLPASKTDLKHAPHESDT